LLKFCSIVHAKWLQINFSWLAVLPKHRLPGRSLLKTDAEGVQSISKKSMHVCILQVSIHWNVCKCTNINWNTLGKFPKLLHTCMTQRTILNGTIEA